MKNDCAKWKDQLLEAALTGTTAGALEEHVLQCANCARELAALRARRERLDALLPLVAQGAEPPADFRARVLAAAEAVGEAKRGRPWRVWGLAGAMVAVVAALLIGLALNRGAAPTVLQTELAAAEKLAEWRAPSDVLLQTSGREILRTTPRLGESFLRVPVNAPLKGPVKRDEEE
jgi:anti-sigma factor RsiW